MNSINCFLNVQIADSGTCAFLGDLCLAPFRYFFKGQTVWTHNDGKTTHVFHVRSYRDTKAHQFFLRGCWNIDINENVLSRYRSEKKHWLATVGAIVLFVPGLFLGILLKVIAYATVPKMIKNHQLAIHHLTRINIKIGSEKNRLDQSQIDLELDERIRDPIHPKVNALIIYGEDDVEINQIDARIQDLNPKKIILIGPQGVLANDLNLLGDTQHEEIYEPLMRDVNSVKEALEHKPALNWSNKGKPYKMMYKVNSI